MSTQTSQLAESIYETLTDDEDARACRDIPDSACQVVPGNFLVILSSQLLTKLGDAIANPKTVLAWVTTSVGAPAIVLSLLVPIRESGSLIPQLVIGGLVRRLPRRKWVWVIGAALQGIAVAGIAAAALMLTGAAAGFGILGLLVVFSLARGLCSVASKDVLGKTIPKGRRGQLTGWSASGAGAITVLLGVVLLLPQLAGLGLEVLGGALVVAAMLWLAAAALFSRVEEHAGDTEGGANALREALSRLSLLKNDAPFRRFVLARALLMCSALSAPYYVALAQERAGALSLVLGAFVVADGLASLVSAPVWGRLADASSRRVLIAAAVITATTGIALFLLARLAPGLVATVWLVPCAYFVLSVAHSGVRVGRKTYLVDLASGNRRTDYVVVSNSLIGVLLLLVGALGVLTPLLGVDGMIALLAVMGAGGAMLAATLKAV